MNERQTLNYDVETLRMLFESGAEWTKQDARDSGWSDRRFRATVSELRRRAYPVVSFSERGSTYRKARDQAELAHFINELRSRRDDLDEQIRALETSTARGRLAPAQMALAI